MFVTAGQCPEVGHRAECFFMIKARGRVSLTSETMFFFFFFFFLLLPSESNKVLLQWNGPYEVLELVNVINYKINVKDVVNTYSANMLKLYVERQNLTSYRSAVIDARCNVKSKDLAFRRETVDTVTSSNIT